MSLWCGCEERIIAPVWRSCSRRRSVRLARISWEGLLLTSVGFAAGLELRRDGDV